MHQGLSNRIRVHLLLLIRLLLWLSGWGVNRFWRPLLIFKRFSHGLVCPSVKLLDYVERVAGGLVGARLVGNCLKFDGHQGLKRGFGVFVLFLDLKNLYTLFEIVLENVLLV